MLQVEGGDYAWGELGKGLRKPRGTPSDPIVVRGVGKVRVKPQNFGGGATLTVHGGSWVTFENVTFEASGTGIFFMPDWQRGQRGWHFIDCEIDGLWDWRAGRSRHPAGVSSKWGISSWSLQDFLWQGGSIHDVYWEHAMYHRNPRGDIVVRGAEIARVGRTAVQVRCPDGEGSMQNLPPGRGRLVIEDCRIADTGLADGGSSITLAGRNQMRTTIADNRIEFGSDPRLVDAWRERRGGARFGGGTVAVWSERDGWSNGPVELSGNQIRYGPGCGDRAAIQVGSTPTLRLLENRVVLADAAVPGPHQDAVVVSPRDAAQPARSAPGYSDVGRHVLRGNQVVGRVLVEGAVVGGSLAEPEPEPEKRR